MDRYSKQSVLPEIGELGQGAISSTSVLCVGAGGLGSAVLQYLAAAGVGRIGIVDDDVVDRSNLQRQVLYKEKQLGYPKVLSAKTNLEKLNSEIQIETFQEMLTTENVEKLFSSYDVIVDGTDNFETKYLINDAAVKFQKPVVFASVTGLEGQVSVFDSKKGPCLRCVYPESSASIPNCAEAGVLGSVVGLIGTIQATECLKLISKSAALEPLIGTLLTIDARDMSIFKSKIKKNENCSVCSVDASEISLHSIPIIAPEEILRNPQDYLLIDVREISEREHSRVNGSVHFPISLLRKDATALSKLALGRKWVTHCASGLRAQEASRILEAHGFQSAVLDHEFGFTKLIDLP